MKRLRCRLLELEEDPGDFILNRCATEASLVVTPHGPLQTSGFEKLAKAIDPFLASKGKPAGLVIYAKAFPGWESFAALVSRLKFVADHHRRMERIAAVTDSEFLKIMPRIADHFVQTEIKHFDLEEKEQAFAWLETGL